MSWKLTIGHYRTLLMVGINIIRQVPNVGITFVGLCYFWLGYVMAADTAPA